jgi:hypothetical protein
MESGGAMVAFAKKFLGVPYVWGGTTPKGWDCSGFVGYVLSHFGIPHPRTAAALQKHFPQTASPTPGDLLFWGRPAYHTAMYIGNGMDIEAKGKRWGTVIEAAGRFTSAGRVPKGSLKAQQFDSGGILAPGLTMALNSTGEGEAVLSPELTDVIRAFVAAMAGGLSKYPGTTPTAADTRTARSKVSATSLKAWVQKKDEEFAKKIELLDAQLSAMLGSLKDLTTAGVLQQLPKIVANLKDQIAATSALMSQKQAALARAVSKGWTDTANILRQQIAELQTKEQELLEEISGSFTAAFTAIAENAQTKLGRSASTRNVLLSGAALSTSNPEGMFASALTESYQSDLELIQEEKVALDKLLQEAIAVGLPEEKINEMRNALDDLNVAAAEDILKIRELAIAAQEFARAGLKEVAEKAAMAIGYLQQRMSILADNSEAFSLIAQRMPAVLATMATQAKASGDMLNRMIVDYQENMANGILTPEQAHQAQLEIVAQAEDALAALQNMYEQERTVAQMALDEAVKGINKEAEAYQNGVEERRKAIDAQAEAQQKAFEQESKAIEEQNRLETEAYEAKWKSLLKADEEGQRNIARARTRASMTRSIGGITQNLEQLKAKRWKTYADYEAMLQAESDLQSARLAQQQQEEDWLLEDQRRALEEQQEQEAKALEEMQRIRAEAFEEKQRLWDDELAAQQKALQDEYDARMKAYQDREKAAQDAYQAELDALTMHYDNLMTVVDTQLQAAFNTEQYSEVMQAAGSSLVDALAAGITAGGPVAIEALKAVLAEMDQYLPHSDAIKGPFSKLTLIGRRLIQTVAEGMQDVGGFDTIAGTLGGQLVGVQRDIFVDSAPAITREIYKTGVENESTLVVDFRNAPTWVTQEMKQELWKYVMEESAKLKRREQVRYGAA